MSDYVENNRSLSNFGNFETMYNYGFLASYGIGFGFPLLLDLPAAKLSCGEEDFKKVVQDTPLRDGVGHLEAKGWTYHQIKIRLVEFDKVLNVKMDCITSMDGDAVEHIKVKHAINNLMASMAARLELVPKPKT